ncbi:HYC_CC_PP family protein [Aquimarina agarivorans]|uniref:HYC_CC_PP family protein n=1 Tax=Aquimarina agarivorans TaxID=980584 RepID=UPI001110A8FB|nr:hypothetical protein [Aquimarina agarivorans]
MKKVFQKISALVLTMLVVFATSSLSISTHFCGTRLVTYSFTESLKTCGGDVTSKATPYSFSLKRKSCCTNKHISKKGQQELFQKKQVEALEKISLNTANQLFHKNYLLFQFALNKQTYFDKYAPPIIFMDRNVRFQQFII